MRQRKKYTDEFKQEAVALVTEQGYKVTDASKSLGINDNNLRRWMTEFKQKVSGEQPTENVKLLVARILNDVITVQYSGFF
ncbi:Mobile element protein [hydrothermal vent metagenome]|uniref:Mobile element protein n=1 Tax=hydrothermal vent metagenome TaxID=652676 RepID=A0A3B1AR20_9ZZZZ